MLTSREEIWWISLGEPVSIAGMVPVGGKYKGKQVPSLRLQRTGQRRNMAKRDPVYDLVELEADPPGHTLVDPLIRFAEDLENEEESRLRYNREDGEMSLSFMENDEDSDEYRYR